MAGATDIVTILGKRGSGKSTLAWEFAKLYPRLVVFDILSEHDESNFDFTVHSFNAFADAMLKTEYSESFKILYRFDVESDAHDDEFNHALRIIYYRGDLAILIEEVWNYSSKGFLPKWLRQTYLTGRHQSLAVITTSQRPASVHKDIMAQTTEFYAGTMFETNDVKYIGEFTGKDNAERLRMIPQFSFLRYIPGRPIEIVKNRT